MTTAIDRAQRDKSTAGTGSPLLDTHELSVRFPLRDSEVRAVSDVSLTLNQGRFLALVGESGCGKSVLAATLLGLLPANARIRGAATVRGQNQEPVELITASESVLGSRVRGRLLGLIPQSASTHLTPVRTARDQLVEAVRTLRPDSPRPSAVAEHLATRVGLTPNLLDHYPHELSGGIAQRVVTALALVGDPFVLLADEPTTGLDRRLAEQTVDLLAESTEQDRSVLMITHDLAAAKRVATDVAVMYASRIVEMGPANDVFGEPWHPYTAGLLAALPENGFRPIPGHPPELTELSRIESSERCAFCHRQPDTPGFSTCTGNPDLIQYGDRWVAGHPPC